MEKVSWDVGWNGVVVGLVAGVKGRERGDEKCFSAECTGWAVGDDAVGVGD